MDWSKAKTILIVIFIILNIFLAYNIYVKESKAVTISNNDISDIVSILKNNNIEVKAAIPTQIKQKSFLKVEDTVFVEDDLVKSLLGNVNVITKTIVNGISVYKSGNKSLEIYEDRTILYRDANPSTPIDVSNKNKTVKYIKDFLKTSGINLNYGVLESYKQTSDGYEINFLQEYKGNSVFVSYMQIKLSNAGITQIKGRWVNPIGFIDDAKDIKTPTEVLLIFSKDIGSQNKININSISLGYYFNLKQTKNAAVSAFPVWKIQTDSSVYYYNAYEGYLENKNNN